MRYIVQDIMLPKDHLRDPNKTVYYVMDLHKRELSLSYYMKFETAQGIVEKKNK